jgi:hypothetical protein
MEAQSLGEFASIDLVMNRLKLYIVAGRSAVLARTFTTLAIVANGWRKFPRPELAAAPSNSISQQLDLLQHLRQQARRQLLAESRDHAITAKLRQVPSL